MGCQSAEMRVRCTFVSPLLVAACSSVEYFGHTGSNALGVSGLIAATAAAEWTGIVLHGYCSVTRCLRRASPTLTSSSEPVTRGTVCSNVCTYNLWEPWAGNRPGQLGECRDRQLG